MIKLTSLRTYAHEKMCVVSQRSERKVCREGGSNVAKTDCDWSGWRLTLPWSFAITRWVAGVYDEMSRLYGRIQVMMLTTTAWTGTRMKQSDERSSEEEICRCATTFQWISFCRDEVWRMNAIAWRKSARFAYCNSYVPKLHSADVLKTQKRDCGLRRLLGLEAWRW